MLQTEPFTAEGKARETVEDVAKTNGFKVVEVGENQIVIKNASHNDILGTVDVLFDKAAKTLRETQNLDSEKMNRWLNEPDYELSDENVGKGAKELRNAAMSLDSVELNGDGVPYEGEITLETLTRGFCEVDGFESLADPEARKKLRDWMDEADVKLKVEVTDEYEVRVNGVSVK